MSSLKLTIPHQLTQDEALQRVRSLFGDLQREQKGKIKNVSEEWNGNAGNFSFTTSGFDLSGKIQVHPESVDIDASLPFALSFFKGKITEVIQERAVRLLS